MIIVLKPGTSKQVVDAILKRIEEKGCKPLYMPGTERVVLGAIGDERVLAELNLESLPEVEKTTPILAPWKMVSREWHPDDSVVQLGGCAVGAGSFTIIAGPCAVESQKQINMTAQAVSKAGASVLRGGAFKPRSSPYSFQGLGLEGVKILAGAAKEAGIPFVTEVLEVSDVEPVALLADCLQVGARNMQNFRLLTALGKVDCPIILKRGMAAGVQDLLMAAEYIVSEGNSQVILCERGIRTFETVTRNTLDLSAVPWIKQKCHLPIIVDPSHGTGVRDLILPMARAAAACGADGIMVEVHPDPAQARSDGKQSLDFTQFEALVEGLKPVVEAMGKTL